MADLLLCDSHYSIPRPNQLSSRREESSSQKSSYSANAVNTSIVMQPQARTEAERASAMQEAHSGSECCPLCIPGGGDPGWAGPGGRLPFCRQPWRPARHYQHTLRHQWRTALQLQKGRPYGYEPQNTTREGECELQCDLKVYLRCASVHARVCGLKIRTGSSALQSSVGGAVLLLVLSVFSDGLSSVLCPGIRSGVVVVGGGVVEMAPEPSEGEPVALHCPQERQQRLGVSHVCDDHPACPVFSLLCAQDGTSLSRLACPS